MRFVDPSQLPELPLEFMNADHAHEFHLLNDVAEALHEHREGRGTAAPVIERLAVLAVNTREDFLREEQAMREARFPGVEAHKAEHDRVLADMNAEVRRFRAGGEPERLWRFLVEVVPGWYVNHIRTMDLSAARFVSARSG
jgi:hemerythrin